jgi:hypothetical protein
LAQEKAKLEDLQTNLNAKQTELNKLTTTTENKQLKLLNDLISNSKSDIEIKKYTDARDDLLKVMAVPVEKRQIWLSDNVSLWSSASSKSKTHLWSRR